jgi:hypothetical protein
MLLVVLGWIALAICWRPHWSPPSPRTVFWLGVAAEVIIVAYCLYLWIDLRKRKWARGDDAIGYGCAWQIFWFFSAAAVLLAVGLVFSWRWVIAPIASCVLVTTVWIAAGAVVEGFKKLKKM